MFIKHPSLFARGLFYNAATFFLKKVFKFLFGKHCFEPRENVDGTKLQKLIVIRPFIYETGIPRYFK
jgi:hypothetical protein